MSPSDTPTNVTTAKNGTKKEVDKPSENGPLHDNFVPGSHGDVALAAGWTPIFTPQPFVGKPSGYLSPAVAVYKDSLFVVWQWDNKCLYFTSMNKSEVWTDAYTFKAVENNGLPHELSTPTPPALATFGGRLHVVTAADNLVLSHYILDDSKGSRSDWTWVKQPFNRGNHLSTEAPSINAVGSALHMSYQARDDHDIIWLYWTETDGWSDYKRLGRYTASTPGIVGVNGSTSPHVIYPTNEDERYLRELACDGANWYDVTSLDERSWGAVYAKSFDDYGVIAFQANQNPVNKDLIIDTWNKSTQKWSRPSFGAPPHTTPAAPAAAGFNGKIYVILCGTEGKRTLYMISAQLAPKPESRISDGSRPTSRWAQLGDDLIDDRTNLLLTSPLPHLELPS